MALVLLVAFAVRSVLRLQGNGNGLQYCGLAQELTAGALLYSDTRVYLVETARVVNVACRRKR
jgi:hypothetical protein